MRDSHDCSPIDESELLGVFDVFLLGVFCVFCVFCVFRGYSSADDVAGRYLFTASPSSAETEPRNTLNTRNSALEPDGTGGYIRMRILIRGTNWIGDAVMTIPAIRKLRRSFPTAKLVLLTPEPTIGLFKGSGLVDEIIPAGSLYRQVTSTRRPPYDLAVLFPNSFKSALAAWLGGAKRRFGYASQNRSSLLSDTVDVPAWKDTRHEVFYYLNLVEHVERAYAVESASAGEQPETDIEVSERELERARSLLGSVGIDRNKMIVGLAPGSTNSRAKRWTAEGFAQLNDRLQREFGVDVVLLGSQGDRDVAARIQELAHEQPIDLTGTTDISMAAAVLHELDLLISNDMGLAHLAPAVGTKTIVIFGPTNPLTTRPFSDLASIVSAGVECSPCMLRDCPIDHRCMTRISADDIFEKAIAILEQSERAVVTGG